jgi:hypothetical protein
MTSFEAGFIKYAEECGLSYEKTVYTFKRAMEHPAALAMFKELPEEEEAPQVPGNLEALSSLLQQQLVHDDMEGAAKKIQL